MDEQRIRILIVEDDDIDRMAIVRHISREHLPYDLQIAASESEALDALRESNFDIILLDYDLGTATGFDVMPHTGDTPVIFVTGSGSEQIAVEAIRKGAYDYLIKDPDRYYLVVLPSTIQTVLERKRLQQDKDNLIRDLKKAVAEVKKLSGLLPICANCKKIRDDKGYWSRIESYIERHSEAIFSHGLCPECEKEMYGNEDWYKRNVLKER